MSTYANVSNDYNIVTDGKLSVEGNIVATGYIQAAYYIGDGQFLTNVTANIGSASILQNGTSNVSIPISSGNINFGVSGTQQMTATTSSFILNYTTPSLNETTGALTIAGGAGIAGNLYANAIYSNNAAVLNVNSVVYGGTF